MNGSQIKLQKAQVFEKMVNNPTRIWIGRFRNLWKDRSPLKKFKTKEFSPKNDVFLTEMTEFRKTLTGSKFNIHRICWRAGHVQSSAWSEIFNFLHFYFFFFGFRITFFCQCCILSKNEIILWNCVFTIIKI